VRAARGFTRFEFALVVAIAALLGGLLLERLSFYQEAAEHARFESDLQTFKTGLQLRMAELIATNREQDLQQLRQASPARWLDQPLPNYAGEYPAQPERGLWYFDSGARELVYVPVSTRFLSTGERRRPPQLRFRVVITGQPVLAPGGLVEGVARVFLDPLYPFQWL
jgi:general secretion pathway protein G